MLFKKGKWLSMIIETKELVISVELKRKVEMICRFSYVDYTITNTNIAMVKPHIFKIKGIDYLIFDDWIIFL